MSNFMAILLQTLSARLGIVSGRDLAVSRLQHVLQAAARTVRDLLHHGKDRADGHVHVDIGRSVEGVEEQDVVAVLERVGDRNDVFGFLRCHGAEPPAVIHRLHDDLVRDDVELLLGLALHVLRAGGAEDVGQPGAADLVRDHLRRHREIVQDAGQLAGGLRMAALLLDDEALDRDDGRCGVANHRGKVRAATGEGNGWRPIIIGQAGRTIRGRRQRRAASVRPS